MTERSRFSTDDFYDIVSRDPIVLNGAPLWRETWLVDRLLLKNGFNILGGVQKAGKSLLRSHLLVAAVTGREALGEFGVPIRAERTLLLAGEELLEAEEARLTRAAYGLGLGDGTELPIHILPQRGFFFDNRGDFESFAEYVRREAYDLVVIDPLIRWHRKDENSPALSPVLTQIRALCAFTTVLVVHHSGKPTQDQENWSPGHFLRGHSDLAAVYDHLLMLRNKVGRSKRNKMLEIDARYGESPDPMDVSVQFEGEAFSFTRRETDEEAVLAVFRNRWTESGEGRSSLSAESVRKMVRRRKPRVTAALKALEIQGFLIHDNDGWRLAEDQ